MDIATLTFILPIFISSPSLVKKMGVIQKIIASVFNSENDLEDAIYNDSRLLSRQYITPLQYSVLLIGNQLSLVRYNSPVVDPIESQVVKKISANVLSNTTITLSSTNDIQTGMRLAGTNINSNCTVIAINGDTITTNTNVTANVGDRISFTLYSYKIGISENWRDLVNVYGNLTNGTSQIKLELDDGNEVMGTVAYHPSNDNVLLWTADIDTMPVNTLEPINAIIDPERSRPNNDLSAAIENTRYLLVNDYVGTEGDQPTYNWPGKDGQALVAYANDIIQFNGQFWFVAFDSGQENSVQYVTNLTTTVQYKFSNGAWTKSYEGPYEAGKWELIL